MAEKKPGLVWPDGTPLRRETLKEEVATVTGVRTILSGHPAQGLTPQRLAAVLREAEDGDPTRQMELAEEIEERFLHYQGVIGTRKRQVSQLPITVIAAADDAQSVADADLVREFLSRDTLQSELFDILDAVGKGWSFTEIVWSTGSGRWMPERLEWRDPRWFRPDPADGRTPRMLGEGGALEPLAPYKFIVHTTAAKSGLPLRGGLIRGIAWWYLFLAFDISDWVQFLERYGQPIRIGKYGRGATADEQATLLRAVRNIAADAGAIIPEGMLIELVEAKISGSIDAFERFAGFANGEVSKAVLGQTGTTENGPYAGTARVHDEVRGDIERADAGLLASTLNRDLARPLIDLNVGPRKAYPRLQIGRPEEVDVATMADALNKLVPVGLKVQMSEVRDKLGFADPDPKSELLAPAAQPQPVPPPASAAAIAAAALPGEGGDAIERLADQVVDAGWEEMTDPLIKEIERLAAASASAEAFLAALPGLAAAMPVDTLATSLGRCLFAARAAGAGGLDIGNGPAEPGHAG
ncbi:Mu-like prophage FluMu protein gp29 [uncultured Alphaproteobacteria bacterium]|uniref:Mu-like prophage FluMu protein gp29 n=1 Tax=uncultured Alphaproteobacteria bacterium TaxID=91750 RepID=A0A212KMV9_9PROT|nr:Mu-like prophage FluMu protein gp29 [uncultured Alphaproteobacteria bacterium]